jgi:hypothetical protein
MAPSTETYRISIDAYNNTYVNLIINRNVVVLNRFNGTGTTDDLHYDIDFV